MRRRNFGRFNVLRNYDTSFYAGLRAHSSSTTDLASSPTREHYLVMGIAPENRRNLTIADLKIAFRKRAIELHPDTNQSDPAAAEKFRKVSDAFEILKGVAKIEEQSHPLSTSPTATSSSSESKPSPAKGGSWFHTTSSTTRRASSTSSSSSSADSSFTWNMTSDGERADSPSRCRSPSTSSFGSRYVSEQLKREELKRQQEEEKLQRGNARSWWYVKQDRPASGSQTDFGRPVDTSHETSSGVEDEEEFARQEKGQASDNSSSTASAAASYDAASQAFDPSTVADSCGFQEGTIEYIMTTYYGSPDNIGGLHPPWRDDLTQEEKEKKTKAERSKR